MSPKKQAVDIKDRKKLAKRIVKAVQPQLEAAVRAEADINNKPVEKLMKELELLLEASLQSQIESVPALIGEAVSLGEAEGDMEMTDADQAKHGVKAINGDSTTENHDDNHDKNEGENKDVEMQDADAPHEEVEDDCTVTVIAAGESEVADAEDTIVAVPLAELDGNISQVKPNGIKNTSTPPDTNGYAPPPESQQPTPPTPPVSNGDLATDNVDLSSGGTLWYLKDFQPEGTSILDPSDNMSRLSEDLSDMDDEELNVLAQGVGGEVAGPVGSSTTTPRTKKGKVKKRWRGFK